MIDHIVKLYQSGMSLRAVGAVLGLSASGVQKIMWRNGHDTRRRGEHNRHGSDEERFDRCYIPEPNSGCWLWIGQVDKHGYGRVTYRGVRSTAQRASFQRFKGSIPSGFQVDHKCFNPSCVNPDHLQAVTKSQNLANRRILPHEFCNIGHPLTPDNVIVWRNGRGTSARRCKICLQRKRGVRST